MMDKATEFLTRHAEVCKRAARVEELNKLHTATVEKLALIETECEGHVDEVPAIYEGTSSSNLKLKMA